MADKDYTWSFADVRTLDSRLGKLESQSTAIQKDIKEIKDELAVKNHIVVDNTTNMDWKTIATIITAVVGTLGTIALAIWGAR